MGSIRALLALTVVLCHSPWLDGNFFVGGRNAVQIFYVISGFLISYLLLEKQSYPSKRSFYISRWLRIWPLYAVVAILTFLLNRHFKGFYSTVPIDAAIVLAVSNIIIFGQDVVMFLGIQDGQLGFAVDYNKSDVLLFNGLIISPAWSLAVEMMFYVIAPFVLHRRWLVVALLTASATLRWWLIDIGIGNNDPWTYRFFPTELAVFLMGALAHQILTPMYKRWLGENFNQAATGATVMLLAFLLMFQPITSSMTQGASSLLVLVIFAATVPLAFAFTVNNKWDTKIGELSYPIYIGHALVLMLVAKYFGRMGITDPLHVTLANVGFSVLFAIFLTWLSDLYFEPLRRKFSVKEKARLSIHPTITTQHP